MNKKTKYALFIGAAAAVVSAVVLLVLYWDKLTAKFCCKDYLEDDDLDVLSDEFADFADVAEG